MKQKIKYLLVVLVFMFSTFNFSFINVNAKPNVIRIGGKNRYVTCKNIAENGWKTSNYAIIATGTTYPDALSSAAIAKKYNAPLILTPSNKLDENAKDELKRLNVKTAFIIGGTGAINSSVKAAIEKLNIQAVRIAGANRFETSVRVAEKLDTKNGIFVATGMDFADALSASPIAASNGMPIILVSKNYVDKSVLNYIKNKNISKTYVIGGTDIINDKVADNFPNVERITGKTKYERNINILNKFKSKIKMDNVYIATGLNYSDALAGAALAGLDSSPIVLIQDNLNTNTHKFLSSNINKIKCLKILGGKAVVHDSVINNIINNKGIDSAPTPTPQSELKTSQDMNRIVYYTPNGKSYHYNRNCRTLKKSKTVLSGKLCDVIRMGKSDPCDICVN